MENAFKNTDLVAISQALTEDEMAYIQTQKARTVPIEWGSDVKSRLISKKLFPKADEKIALHYLTLL